ncbi:MAG: class I SAM-dependent methyltransferase [Deltaproteobacteria bacterium]|nr:class I SAM-dependent methyltransferase [Deltaproteobacteria bacterium]
MPVFHQHCPLCDSVEMDDLYFNVNRFTIVRCRSCRLVFVKEKLSTGELAEYYNRIGDEDCVYADPENVENLNYYFHKLKDLIQRRIPGGRILDIGCSAGYFLDVMEHWERYGIEISSLWAEKARQKYGDRIHIGTFEDSKYPDEFFDVITLQDVFDHLANPLESLALCRRILKPSGWIIIKVHNIECLYACVTGRKFYAIIPPSHLFYYSDKTLRLALEKSGFSHEASTFIGHTLFLKTIPYRLAQTRQRGLAYRAYQILGRSSLGNVKIRKNLHDIITVIGMKK